jgi:hypothetical protein
LKLSFGEFLVSYVIGLTSGRRGLKIRCFILLSDWGDFFSLKILKMAGNIAMINLN